MAGFWGGPSAPTWAAVAASLLLTACSAGADGSPDPGSETDGATTSTPSGTEPADPDGITDADFAAVQKVLDVRARALRRGDRAAFVATLDPGNQRLRRDQLVFFDNVQELPVSDLYYGTTDSGLPEAKIRGGDPTLRPGTFEHLQLEGVFAKPIANAVSITFVERDGRWLVGAEILDKDFEPQSRPWYGGRIEVAQDDKLLVVTDDDADVDAETLLDSTREALQQVSGVIEEPADPALVVDATSNGLTTPVAIGTDEEAGAVAFDAYAASPDGEKGRGKVGSVAQANPDNVEQLVEDTRTLRHEMVHVLLDGYGDTNPKWVTEGIAEYAASSPLLLSNTTITDDEVADDVAKALKRRTVELTPIYAWGDDSLLDYLLAEAAAEYLIQRDGVARYRELMDTFKRRSRAESAPYGDGLVDEVLRKVYGLSAREVARESFALAEGVT